MRIVRIATVSYLVEETPHTIDMNIARTMSYVDSAAEKSADIVCLPESVVTTNVPPDLQYHAEPFPGKITKALCVRARSKKINIIVPYLVRVGKRIFNQTTIIDRKGRIAGYYRKVHLNGFELATITPGDKLPVFTLDFGKISAMTCLDIYFPEIARIYTMKGAEIIFWSTITHGPTQETLSTQVRARAMDNSVVLVEANLAEAPPYAPYAGRTKPATARIIDHHGDIIAATGRRHGIAIADIDLDEVRLTSQCMLLREPDHIREDLQKLTRLDLYAKEYFAFLKKQARNGSDKT